MTIPTTNRNAGTIGRFRSLGWSSQLVVLALFLAAVFLAGGSARYDTPQVIVLRPIAICVAGFALTTFSWQHVREYRALWILFAAGVLLTIAHLIPLPPEIWRALPGREIVAEIDALTGSSDLWRPLTLFPEGTWNALYALSVPFAALLLASQLDERDLIRLLQWVILLCFVSGLMGVIQAAGSDLRFYRFTGGTGGLFANRNHQAVMLACVFPMLAAWALVGPQRERTRRAVHVVAGACAIALVPLILVTGSRMGLVVTAFAFVYSALVLLRHRPRVEGNRYVRAGLVVGGLVAVVGIVMATIAVSRDVAIDRMNASGDEMRWPIWENMVDFIPNYLPWGSGIGSFVPVYQIHESADLLLPRYVNQAHNDWLDLVLTAGLPGMVLALVALAMLAKAAVTALGAKGIAGHLRRAGLGVIVVLAFASMSDYPVRTPILSAVLAIAAIWLSAPLRRPYPAESNRLDAKN